ncbi:hypothetical protein L2E82_23088 [Cichorium intybus]|uniref:Uncharacterized protein n=1 Tax=Cichorium intybus TaxID=13427 RepID=A0ACB9E001_CICIN|nr:hypothetical protein L2E82_23088 [Cichorium intybus]
MSSHGSPHSNSCNHISGTCTANFLPTDHRLCFQINRLPATVPNQRLTCGFHHRPLLPPHARATGYGSKSKTNSWLPNQPIIANQ